MSISDFLFKPMLVCFVLPALFLFSCRKPDGNNPPESQLASYTKVSSDRVVIPELFEWGYFKSFLIDSGIYLLSFNTPKLAVIDLEGDLKQLTTLNTVDYGMSNAVYDPVHGYFYISGVIDYETGFYDTDPYFLIFDRNANIIHEKIYLWPGTDDGLKDVICMPGKDPVLVTYTRDESIGINGQQIYSMIFLDNNFDSLRSIELPFDSCSLDFIDITDEEIIRIILTQTDSINNTTLYTHKIFAEMDLEGNILNMQNLTPDIKNHIYIENSDPMHYYNWYVYNKSVIALQKYTESGSVVGSVSIDLLPVKYPIYDFAVTFGKDKNSESNLLFGAFYYYSYAEPPDFHGNFIVKFDDEANELYRVAFDEDLTGFIRYGPNVTIVDTDMYVFLYLFQTDEGAENFCFSKVKVD